MEIELRDPYTLRNHVANIAIYGDVADEEMVESVRQHGILTPLTVTAESVVVSGHRRMQAARFLKLKAIPVHVCRETDPDTIERLVIEANRQRRKTPEQMAREAQRLLAIAEREAAKREAATQAKPGVGQVGLPGRAPVPYPENPAENANTGKAAADVASTLGVSPRTVANLKAAADAIDEAEDGGDAETAESIRTTLNERGPAPAAKHARERRKTKAVQREAGEAGVPPKVAEALATRPKWLGLQSRLGTIRNEAQELMDGPGGMHADRSGLVNALADAGHQIRFAAPAAVCPACEGTGKCGAKGPCRGHGWMNADLLATWKRLHGGAT